MTAQIYPYPFCRNRLIVAAIAREMNSLEDKDAGSFLSKELDIVWDHLERRGLDEAQVEAEVLAYAAAIRSVVSVDRAEVLDQAVSGIGRGRRVDARPSLPSRGGETILHVEIAPPTAKVLLLSPIRPAEYVERVAGIFLGYERAKGEQLLALEMSVITDKLLTIGADPAAVASEVKKLENSIRAAMWHQVMGTSP